MKNILNQIKKYIRSLTKKQKATALIILVLVACFAVFMAILTAMLINNRIY